MIIICDIDGTAADISHRAYLVEGKNEGKKVDWPKFINEMVSDIAERDGIRWPQSYFHHRTAR